MNEIQKNLENDDNIKEEVINIFIKALEKKDDIETFEKIVLNHQDFSTKDFQSLLSTMEDEAFALKVKSELESKWIDITFVSIILNIITNGTATLVYNIKKAKNENETHIDLNDEITIDKDNADNILEVALKVLSDKWMDIDKEFNIWMLKNFGPWFYLLNWKYLIDLKRGTPNAFLYKRSFWEFHLLENSNWENVIYQWWELYNYSYSINEDLLIFKNNENKEIGYFEVEWIPDLFRKESKDDYIWTILLKKWKKILIWNWSKKFIYNYENTKEIEDEYNIDWSNIWLFYEKWHWQYPIYWTLDLNTLEEWKSFHNLHDSELLIWENEIRDKGTFHFLGTSQIKINTRSLNMNTMFSFSDLEASCILNNNEITISIEPRYNRDKERSDKSIVTLSSIYLQEWELVLEGRKENWIWNIYIKNPNSKFSKLLDKSKSWKDILLYTIVDDDFKNSKQRPLFKQKFAKK